MAIGPRSAAAQQGEPLTTVPGTAAIWTDKQQYQIGEAVQICYRIPVAGNITITDLPADGSRRTFYTGPSQGTGACLPGVITPPPGHECMRLDFPLVGGTGTTQTCFQVVGPTPPPPPGPSITTDRTSYRFGDPIRVCYGVPGPGPVTITDKLANGQQQVFISGYDDGTGGCVPGTVTPPAGTECMAITYTDPATSLQSSAQTCFQVLDPAPPPPAGWTYLGWAQIDPIGNWTFETQVQVPTNLTYVRATSGGCDDSPNVVAVWEGQMVTQPGTPLGVAVLAGGLQPIGLAARGNSGGWGYIQRPLVENPVETITLSLFGMSPAYQGFVLSVCLRAP
jgi:hypothetical protein